MNISDLKGQLIVSCQALENEPLHSSMIMARMALAAKEGGAKGIRANSPEDIREIKATVDLPVIGIWKRDYEDSNVYITPTRYEVEALLETEVEIIALDATKQKRPNDESIGDLLALIHRKNRLAMADISTLEEAIEAERLGFDLISTTLAGYTPYSKATTEPDFELLEEIVQKVAVPVIMEGHTSKPEQVTEGLKRGAFAVVVGSIITRPKLITERYVNATKW
ncbi:N-acetylmannosamine-6-phosphate 2-epimerase [Listeria monocytogenes]|uniref:Putative N-acetylmannosamine-6-phosphate 2-epimerase n=1 Tax=Listeria monocytogenes TaxID=1639 RepID=A0A3T2I508_LISMN|nr:N-acetylmannosamine-6-phosphate 2-epimerase [Listeria monocytogenes]EAE3730993.1 N-acetylmannosamine-6-phosphate 2-epimerase [Listeria monocytogenes serotype 1/2a]AEO02415.1 N-acetylmannosamine-6-phosphate 2-epimerase [Listeria monocytogenes J0161]AQP64025.1 N-acetylmannosamine-6-phosphate 2-epimerase [Listeria monocytogenes]ARJ91382.1 N-acetylmannosamine-6-phosphate 2-epimerase [Listeria monocytogenes]AVV08662.1 putative N-acetylmannosamine-6-phosphate 2-epimerase [Listeria monocytogenes]